MKKNNENLDVKVVPEDKVGVDSFGFEDATEADLSNDGLLNGIAFVRGTIDVYDHMINDERVDSKYKKELKMLRDDDISLLVGELKIEIEKRINSGDSLDGINKVIDLFKYDLDDAEYVKYLEDRLSSLDERNELDFSVMSNKELYVYLNSLEGKIRKSIKENLDISSNEELHDLLDLAVKLQVEVDRRVEFSRAKKSSISLEAELDDFAKEQDKVRRAKHFSKDDLIDKMNEEKEISKGRGR